MMTTTSEAPAAPAEWRRLDAHLWVARRDGRPIGMVEQGARYVSTDADVAALGAFRTLREAQDAVEDGTARPQHGTRAVGLLPWAVTGSALLVTVAGGAVLLLR